MVSRYLTDGILIAVITVGGYLAAFRYEVAYLDYFGVPIFFASVDLTIILIAVSGTIIFCILSFLVYLGLQSTIEHTLKGTFFEKVVDDVGGIISFAGTILLISVFIYRENFDKWWFALLFFVFVVFFYFFLPLIYPRFKEWLLHRTSVNLEKRQARGSFNVFDIANHPLGSLALTVIFLWSAMIIGQSLGDSSALTQKIYTVVSTNPPAIVLIGYKESLIIVPLNNDSTLADNFSLLSMDKIAENNLTFTKQQLGHLRVKKGLMGASQ